MKRLFGGLFGRIVLALIIGAALGAVLPDTAMRAMKTFNILFAQLLKFMVPLLILGLVTPAIAGVGKGAGKMLLAVMAASYLSTVAAGFFAYAASGVLMPHYIHQGLFEAAGNGRENEVTVHIGDRSRPGPLYDHSGSDQSFSQLIQDLAFYAKVLGERMPGHKEQKRQKPEQMR